MAFSDTDPLEDDMGIRCEDMSPDQLVAYIKSYHAAFGLNISIDGHPERAVFRGMQRIYGPADTGRIVKWVFYKYRGHYDNQIVTPLSFAKGRKWWVDRMHLEMQQEQARLAPKSYTAAAAEFGMRSLADL